MSPVDWSHNASNWNDPHLNQSSLTPLHPFQHSLPLLTQAPASSTAPADYDYSAVGRPVPSDRITLGVCMFVVVGVTFTANLFVLVSFIVEKKLRTTFSALIAHLAFVDMFVGVMAMNAYTINIMYGYWPFGKVLCGFFVVLDHNLVYASCYTLAAIAIDRMWSITWSINYRQHNGMKKAAGFIIVIWCLVFSIIMYPVISDRVLRTRLYHCVFVPAQNPQFSITLAALGHHLPCCTIVGCSIFVFVQIKKLVRTRPAAVEHQEVGEANMANRAMPSRTVKLNQPGGGFSVEQAMGGTGWRWGWLKRCGSSASVAQKLETNVEHVVTDCAAGEERDTKMAAKTKVAAAAMPSTSTSTQSQTNETLDRSSATHSQTQLSAGTVKEKGRRESPKPMDRARGGGGGEGAAKVGVTGLSREEKERRTFVTLAYIIALYVICWIPFHIVYDLSFISPTLVSENAYKYTFWLAYANSTVNPFLYAFTSSDLRATIWRIVTCRQFKRRH